MLQSYGLIGRDTRVSLDDPLEPEGAEADDHIQMTILVVIIIVLIILITMYIYINYIYIHIYIYIFA